MLSTAEGMLQHCREAEQPVLQQETHSGLGLSLCSALTQRQEKKQTKPG